MGFTMQRKFTFLLPILVALIAIAPPSHAGLISNSIIGTLVTAEQAAAMVARDAIKSPGVFRPIGPFAAAGLVVGAMYAYSQISDDHDNKMRTLMGAATRDKQDIPPGWTDSDHPPGTVSYGPAVLVGSCRDGRFPCSPAEIALSYCQYFAGPTGIATQIPIEENHDFGNGIQPGMTEYCSRGASDPVGWFPNWQRLQYAVTCPNGYVQNAANGCDVLNPASIQWPSDGIPSYIPDPTLNRLIPMDRDPDNTGLQPIPEYSRAGQDPMGNPTKETIRPNSAHGIDYQRDVETQDPQTGLPKVVRYQFSTDSSGQVISNTVNEFTNTTLNNTTTTNIDTSKLNQESTQLRIKDLLDPKTNPDLKTVEDPLKSAYADQKTIITSQDTTLNINPAENYEIKPYWTFASGSCYPALFDAGRFGNISFQPFCSIYDTYIRYLLVFAFAVWGANNAYEYWSETVKEI